MPKPICCSIGDGGTNNGVLNAALLFAVLRRCGVWNGDNGLALIFIEFNNHKNDKIVREITKKTENFLFSYEWVTLFALMYNQLNDFDFLNGKSQCFSVSHHRSHFSITCCQMLDVAHSRFSINLDAKSD